MPSTSLFKKIGGRDFELYIGATHGKIEYHLEITSKSDSVGLRGEFPHTDSEIVYKKWAAQALRQIVASQKCELPRLQGYEIYLLNLWARELSSTTVTVVSA
mgnify:CR=1 FL=1